MSLVQFTRCTPSLTHLEDRCTPTASFTVSKAAWDPTTIGSLPWAVEQANSPAHPGLDVIVFDFTAGALGPKPTLNATGTLDVTEGVHILGANGNDYVTITGTRPFEFTHAGPAAVPLGEVPATSSIIDRVQFDNCAAPAGFNGGAIENRGTVVLKRAWFIENTAGRNGGGIHVDDSGVLSAPTLPGGEGWVNPDVQLLANTAKNGGGLAYRSTAASDLNGVIFGYNQATAEGGGMWVKQGTVNLVGGTVANNSAVTGQGMFIESADPMNVATVNADGVSFFGNVTPLGKAANPAEIGSNGILNTSGCFFNTGGLPVVVAGTNGQYNWDPMNPDTP